MLKTDVLYRNIVACMTMFVFLFMSGCAVHKENSSSAETEEVTDILSVVDGNDDNTLDIYAATIRTDISIKYNDQENGEIPDVGMKCLYIGENEGIYFVKHMYDSSEKCWDELKIRTDSDELKDLTLDFSAEGFEQVICMGNIWGSDHFLMYTIKVVDKDYSNLSHVFFEVDGNLNVRRCFTADFLQNDITTLELPQRMLVDKNENVHLLTMIDQVGWQYYVMDKDGNLLFHDEVIYNTFLTLHMLYDGNVALQVNNVKTDDQTGGYKKNALYQADVKNADKKLVASVNADVENGASLYVPGNGDVLIHADVNGVYQSDLSGNNKKSLYEWNKHGLPVDSVHALRVYENGNISVMIGYKEQTIYLCLTPVTEKKDIKEISFGVSSVTKTTYAPAVAEFNRNHPAYHINLVDDYDETFLLTQLIAGDGPVLIDTSLIGFETHANLWWPLDDLFSSLQLDEQLVGKAMDLGRINGVLYGVISNFWLETVVIKDAELRHWDYEGFLERIQNNQSIRYIYNTLDDNDCNYLIPSFFAHGLSDCYYIDIAENSFHVRKDRLLELLKLNIQYVKSSGRERDDLWPTGNTLCDVVRILRPADMEIYRAYYGDGINYIGFPSKTGAGHYCKSYDPIAVRKTATKEEKAIAASFFKYLLSYDIQLEASKTMNFSLSVRKDVLDQQFNEIKDGKQLQIYGYPQMIANNVDPEKDREVLYELIEGAEAYRYFPEELNHVFLEELTRCLHKEVDVEKTADILKNRIQLFLDEGSYD